MAQTQAMTGPSKRRNSLLLKSFLQGLDKSFTFHLTSQAKIIIRQMDMRVYYIYTLQVVVRPLS